MAEQAAVVVRLGSAGVPPAAWRQRPAIEAAVVMARPAGAPARRGLPVVRHRRWAAVALDAIANVLRVGDVVRALVARVRAPGIVCDGRVLHAGHLEALAHVHLVDEDRHVHDRFVVHHLHVAGPCQVSGDDGSVGQRDGRRLEPPLIVVARDAGADVEARAAVELARPQRAGGAGDGAERGVALEASRLVDLLVLSGHVRARGGNEVLHDVDGRERRVGRLHGDQDDEAVHLRRVECGACPRRAGDDVLGEPIRVGAVGVIGEPARAGFLGAGAAVVVRRHVADPVVVRVAGRGAVPGRVELEQREAPADERRRQALHTGAVPLADRHAHDRPAVVRDDDAGELDGDLRLHPTYHDFLNLLVELRRGHHRIVDHALDTGRASVALRAWRALWTLGAGISRETLLARRPGTRERCQQGEEDARFRFAPLLRHGNAPFAAGDSTRTHPIQ